jgi:hypothetical protein
VQCSSARQSALKKERLAVAAESARIRDIYSAVDSLSMKVLKLTWQTHRLHWNLDLLLNSRLSVAVWDKKYQRLAQARFVNAYAHPLLGANAAAVEKLLTTVRASPQMLAWMLCSAEKSSQEVLAHIVMFALLGNLHQPANELAIISLFESMLDALLPPPDSMRAFFRSSTLVAKFFSLYSRNFASGRLYLQAALHEPFMQLLADDSGIFEIEPSKLLPSLPADLRARVEDACRNSNGSILEAAVLAHPDLQSIFRQHYLRIINIIRDIVDRLTACVPVLPAGITGMMRSLTHRMRLSGLPEPDIVAIVSEFFIQRFIIPGILHPEPHGIVTDLPFTSEAFRNIAIIAKVIKMLSLGPPATHLIREDHMIPVAVSLNEHRISLRGLVAALLAPAADGPGQSILGFPPASVAHIGRRDAIVLTKQELELILSTLNRAVYADPMAADTNFAVHGSAPAAAPSSSGAKQPGSRPASSAAPFIPEDDVSLAPSSPLLRRPASATGAESQPVTSAAVVGPAVNRGLISPLAIDRLKPLLGAACTAELMNASKTSGSDASAANTGGAGAAALSGSSSASADTKDVIVLSGDQPPEPDLLSEEEVVQLVQASPSLRNVPASLLPRVSDRVTISEEWKVPVRKLRTILQMMPFPCDWRGRTLHEALTAARLEAVSIGNVDLATYLEETMRSLGSIPREAAESVLAFAEQEYCDRLAYLEYLASMKQALLVTQDALQHRLQQGERDLKVCLSYTVSVKVNGFLYKRESDLVQLESEIKDRPLPDERARVVEHALLRLRDQMSSDPIWQGCTELDSAAVLVERHVMARVFKHAFRPNGDVDKANDEVILEHIKSTQKFATLDHPALQVSREYWVSYASPRSTSSSHRPCLCTVFV